MKNKSFLIIIFISSIIFGCSFNYGEQLYDQNTFKITEIQKEKDVYIITASKRDGKKIKIVSYYDKNIGTGKKLKVGSLFSGTLKHFFLDSIGGVSILRDPYIINIYHDVEISPAKLKTDSVFLAPSLNGPYIRESIKKLDGR